MKRYKQIGCALLAGLLLCGVISVAAPQRDNASVQQAEIPIVQLTPEEPTEYTMKVADRIQLQAAEIIDETDPEEPVDSEEPAEDAPEEDTSNDAPEAADDTMVWESDNPDVVSVTEDGLAEALAEGEAMITGTRENGEILTCEITVSGYAVLEIIVTPEKDTMLVGETQQLTAEILPEQAESELTWSSLDEGVLTVDQNGVVTAVGEGSADIVVQAENGYVYGCTIVVSGYQLTGISLNPTAVKLKVGASQQVTVLAQPEAAKIGEITWSSSNTKIAKVSASGVITGVSEGTAVVTATTESGKQASCAVTVLGVVTGISLDHTVMTLQVGDTATLKATVTPSHLANQTLTWTSSNAAVARVDAGGKITAVKAGVATITVSCDSAKATCRVTVKEKTRGDDDNPSGTGVTGGPGILYIPDGIEVTRLYTMPEHMPDAAFLTFDSDMGANTTAILSTLDTYDISATFFVPAGDLYACDDLLRQIAGSGHSIGLLLTPAQAADENAVSLLDGANEQLSVITGTPTRLVRISGGSGGNITKDDAARLENNGYRLWDWNAAPLSYQAAVMALDKTGNVSLYFTANANTQSVLQQLLPYMKYCGIPAKSISAGDPPYCQIS